ncbi:hypothetical protein ACFLTG_01830 [Chloroflexota bacterium]
MKIAVDAMGGDYAPEEIVKGAVMGDKESMAQISYSLDQARGLRKNWPSTIIQRLAIDIQIVLKLTFLKVMGRYASLSSGCEEADLSPFPPC